MLLFLCCRYSQQSSFLILIRWAIYSTPSDECSIKLLIASFCHTAQYNLSPWSPEAQQDSEKTLDKLTVSKTIGKIVIVSICLKKHIFRIVFHFLLKYLGFHQRKLMDFLYFLKKKHKCFLNYFSMVDEYTWCSRCMQLTLKHSISHCIMWDDPV